MIRRAVIVMLTLAMVSTCIAWTLSFWGSVGCSYFIGRTQQSIQAYCRDGQVTISLSLYADDDSPSVNIIAPSIKTGFGLTNEVIEVHYTNSTVYMHSRRIHSPAWAVALLFGTVPLIAVIRGQLRRWRRSRMGLCPNCAYDLRGNVSGVCPECGVRIPKQGIASTQSPRSSPID